MLVAVRIRGSVGLDKKTKDTLKSLSLTQKNSCMLFPEKREFTGMLRKIKDIIAYGKIEEETLKLLLEKYAYIGNKPLTEVLDLLKYKSIENLAKDLVDEKISIYELKEKGLKVPFKLPPPSKGFRSIRKGYAQKGELGFQGTEINSLLRRMI